MRSEPGTLRRRQRGLTLLEVLAAVALMGLVYTALASKATQGVMSESDSLRRFQASLIADEKLAEIEIGGALRLSPELGLTEGTTKDGIFLVSVEVTPWSVPVPDEPETTPAPAGNVVDILSGSAQEPGALLEVRVRVAWRGAVGERSIERVTYVLDYESIGQLGSPLPPGFDEEES